MGLYRIWSIVLYIHRMNLKLIIFTCAFILYPPILWATRGPQDYGIIMTLMFMLYSFPIGLLLLCFIIYSIVKLKALKSISNNQGKIVFTLSSIIVFSTILIPLFWISWSDWNNEMIQLMSGVFVPVLILSIISAVLSRLVKKRSTNIENDVTEV